MSACQLVVHLSWGTSHSGSSTTLDTLYSSLCALSTPIGLRAILVSTAEGYAVPDTKRLIFGELDESACGPLG